MNRFIFRLKILFRICIYKTIWINFKCLPFSQAIKFPIIVGRGTVLRNLSGKIIFKCKVKPAIFTIGVEYIFNDCKYNSCIIDNRGEILIYGKVLLHTGIILHTRLNGMVVFNGLNRIGANSYIIAATKITFGYNLQMSWNVQVIDTDLHYIIDTETEVIKSNTKPILIGKNVWIGNNVCLKKGVVIPSNSIVGSFSVVVKGFDINENGLLIMGSPAVVKRKGVKMLFDTKKEEELNIKYRNN